MALTVKSRRAMSSWIDSEGSATISKSWRPGPDAPPCDLEVLDASVRLERLAQALVVHAGDDEVGILGFEPEQLVPDRAADEVRVEVEAAHEVLDRLVHGLVPLPVMLSSLWVASTKPEAALDRSKAGVPC